MTIRVWVHLSKEFVTLYKCLFYRKNKYRDIINDVSKSTIESELKRDSVIDLIVANFSRVEESSRVLEEALKLASPKDSNLLKNIRYELYDLEKRFLELRYYK